MSPARGFVAEHAHYVEDAGYWEAQADRLGGPVVDLGAAAGRVTLALAARGHEVWAVDTDPEMLAVIGERANQAGVAERIHPVLGSMVDAPLPAGAGLVMIPMNTLQVLRARDEQVACLRNVAAALRPGGELIFDLITPLFPAIEGAVGADLDMGHSIDPDNGDLLMHTAVFDDVHAATGEVRMRIVVDRIHRDGSRDIVERHHHLHLFEPEEIPRLAADAGLRVVDVNGGFRGEAPGPDAERHVWRLARDGA